MRLAKTVRLSRLYLPVVCLFLAAAVILLAWIGLRREIRHR